jgi:transcriptional regulator NrdR family protein
MDMKTRRSTFKCAEALSIVVKTPDDSTTYSAPKLPQGISEGSLKIKVKTHKMKSANKQRDNLNGKNDISTRWKYQKCFDENYS